LAYTPPVEKGADNVATRMGSSLAYTLPDWGAHGFVAVV
jgi:hypothetical protein